MAKLSVSIERVIRNSMSFFSGEAVPASLHLIFSIWTERTGDPTGWRIARQRYEVCFSGYPCIRV